MNTSKYTSANVTKDAGEVYFVASDAESAVYVLLNGKLVSVTLAGEQTLVGHTWVVDVEKGVAKCSNCGTTGKVYKTFVEVPNGADADQVAGVWVVADASNTPTETKPDSNKSPKTFDAGIAMYVGMALTSVAGSAVVIGKKKEF